MHELTGTPEATSRRNRPPRGGPGIIRQQESRRRSARGPVQARVRGEQWSRASGVLSLESQDPAQIDDRMHVASVTKTFVAVSVLKLVAEDKIALEDPVSRHLPVFETVMHPRGPVTVRHLLNHQSGMPDCGSVPDVLGTSLNSQERLALASTFRWSGTPGEGFEYSNANYVALGMIVERLRGQPIGAVLRSDVADPLGLSGTSMTEPGPIPERMVHGYITVFGERIDAAGSELAVGSPGGGLISTVADLNTFFSALLQGRLLPPDLVKEMQRTGTAPYGLGVVRWADTCTNDFYYGHDGNMPGYGTISVSSADGTRQVSMSLAYPPEPFSISGNDILDDMTEVVVDALNSAC